MIFFYFQRKMYPFEQANVPLGVHVPQVENP